MALIKVPDKLLCVKSKSKLLVLFFLNDTLFPVSTSVPCQSRPHAPHFSLHIIVRGFFPKTQIRLCQSSAQSLSKVSHFMWNSIQSSYFSLQGCIMFLPWISSDLICYFLLLALLQTHPLLAVPWALHMLFS